MSNDSSQSHIFTYYLSICCHRERKIGFYGKWDTFRKLLHDMGFEYETRDGGRFVVEQPHIVLKRIRFLKCMKQCLDDGIYDICWLDETWTFQKGTGKRKDWQDNDVQSCSVKSAATGDRWIVCHAGGRNGFVPGASLFVRSGKRSKVPDDYHADMNGERFKKWFKEQLLPNIKRPTLIVMDNAPYHSMQVRLAALIPTK